MKQIQMLDCTLRDGGYVNEWDFGESTILCLAERLIDAHVDIVEVGFLDDSKNYNINKSIQPSTKCYDLLLKSVDKKRCMLVAMIDYGTCSIENILPCESSILDGIRIIFKKQKMFEAIEFGAKVKKMGYKVFFQMVSTTSYSDRDVLDFVDQINLIEPFAISIVDTYGLMHKEEVVHYLEVLDHNLSDKIKIGYHPHNNFQLAYANICELLKINMKHDLIVDGTLYGIGKSAGNAPLELIAMYLNENCGKNYDINQLLEAIEMNILPIYEEKHWGYNLLFYIAASNDCHPDYVKYLLNKKTISVRDINMILNNIPGGKKLNYDKEIVEELYLEYQKKMSEIVVNTNVALFRKLSGYEICLLGPGRSLVDSKSKIDEYLRDNKRKVIALNFLPNFYDNVDYVFVSNAKRYTALLTELRKNEKSISIIGTSNIQPVGKDFEYTFCYSEIIAQNHLIEDNSLILFLNILKNNNIRNVTLIGFDGFSFEGRDNYYNSSLNLAPEWGHLQKVNEAIKQEIGKMKKDIDIKFFTKSQYNQEKE